MDPNLIERAAQQERELEQKLYDQALEGATRSPSVDEAFYEAPRVPLREEEVDVAEKFKDVEWVATHLKVHFVTSDLVPYCLMRKGRKSKPLRRYFAQGKGLDSAQEVGNVVCQECLKN